MSLPDVGDLAIVTRVCGCAESLQYLGLIFRVEAVRVPTAWILDCRHCYKTEPVQEVVENADYQFLRAWTRRIEPLSEQEQRSEAVDIRAAVREELGRQLPRIRVKQV